MHVTQEMRQQACEGLLHFTPKKALARELGVSVGSIRDWAIYIQHGFFDWVDNPWVTRRPELLQSAVDYWFEHYPIGYSDVAKQFGVRPATLFQKIRRTVAKLPEQLRPKRILFWDVKPETSLGTFRMAIEKLSDIPADRPLTLAERKALLKEMQDARGRLICAESILEVAIEGCKDELKKRIAATVRAHEKGLSVAHACRLMGLSRSTFYASQKTTPAQIKTDELAEKISEVQSSCFFTIGRRRMGAVLHKRYGIEVCETTLQRVMSRRGLTARIRQGARRSLAPARQPGSSCRIICSTVSSKLIGRCTASLLMSPMCRTSKTTNGEVVWIFWTPYKRSGLLSAVFFSRCEVIPQEALE